MAPSARPGANSSASPPPPATTNNFDTPEYDALQQQKLQPAGAQAEWVARDCLEEILHQFNLSIHEHKAFARTLHDAVDSCLATCLEVIEMQYPAREDHPVSVISLEHGSWEQEKPPDPCSFDSWLRSALPESTQPTTSTSSPRSENWVMQQFLNKQPSMHRSTSVRSNGSAAAGAADLDAPAAERDGAAAASGRPLRSPAVAYAPGTAEGGGGRGTAAGGSSRLAMGTGTSTRSLNPQNSRRNVTKLDTRRVLTPEQEHLEEQLRQELQQRKTQEEMSRKLEQRDAEERSKLASLRRELKGKDYTYDHKGEVVILNEFDPERTPLEALSGPGFKVAGPEDAIRAASPKRRTGAGRTTSGRTAAAAAAAGGGVGGGAAAGGGGGAPGGAGGEAAAAAGGAGGGGGFSLTGGGLGLGGGRGTMSPTEMRKERDRRLASDFKKIQPKTQPSALETLMPAGGVTLRGAGGATKSGPLRPAPAGITREAYAKQIAKKALQAQAEAAGAHAPVTPLTMGLSVALPRDGGASGTAGGGGGSNRGGGASGAAAARSSQSVTAGTAGTAGAKLDPLAAYGDPRHDPLVSGRLRRPSGGRGAMEGGGGGGGGLLAAAASAASGVTGGGPSTPDINLSLTSAGDWGAAGNGRSYEAPPAMLHVKPTEKQLVETVGRMERLPRDRASLPTLAPPLSPLKAGAPKPAERLQFHSILAE